MPYTDVDKAKIDIKALTLSPMYGATLATTSDIEKLMIMLIDDIGHDVLQIAGIPDTTANYDALHTAARNAAFRSITAMLAHAKRAPVNEVRYLADTAFTAARDGIENSFPAEAPAVQKAIYQYIDRWWPKDPTQPLPRTMLALIILNQPKPPTSLPVTTRDDEFDNVRRLNRTGIYMNMIFMQPLLEKARLDTHLSTAENDRLKAQTSELTNLWLGKSAMDMIAGTFPKLKYNHAKINTLAQSYSATMLKAHILGQPASMRTAMYGHTNQIADTRITSTGEKLTGMMNEGQRVQFGNAILTRAMQATGITDAADSAALEGFVQKALNIPAGGGNAPQPKRPAGAGGEPSNKKQRRPRRG